MADSGDTTRAVQHQRHGIYVASKCRHAEKWKALRALGCPIISSWIDESEPGQTNSFADLWARNILEASGAAAVIFYVEPGETMKGSLVEIGAAMAHGVPVYGVGTPEGCTFREHPAFCECPSLDDALRSLGWVKAKPVAPPAAPDALREAIVMVQDLSIHDEAVRSVRMALGAIYRVLCQARAAHAEELAAARAEATYWRGQQEAAAERHRAEVLAHAKTKEIKHAEIAASRAEVEGLRKERDTPGSYYDLARGVIKERDVMQARVCELEHERDTLRASLAAAQEREGKMREALEDPWRAVQCVGDRGPIPDAYNVVRRFPDGRGWMHHKPGDFPLKEAQEHVLRLNAELATLSQPTPAVPEAAPCPGEVERIKMLEEQITAAWIATDSGARGAVALAEVIQSIREDRDSLRALHQDHADTLARVRAALSAPAKEGK